MYYSNYYCNLIYYYFNYLLLLFLYNQSFLWDILRNWTKSHPVSRKNLNSPGSAILEKDPQVIIELSEARASRKRDSVSRFMPNPEENWGPKARAKGRQHILFLSP